MQPAWKSEEAFIEASTEWMKKDFESRVEAIRSSIEKIAVDVFEKRSSELSADENTPLRDALKYGYEEKGKDVIIEATKKTLSALGELAGYERFKGREENVEMLKQISSEIKSISKGIVISHLVGHQVSVQKSMDVISHLDRLSVSDTEESVEFTEYLEKAPHLASLVEKRQVLSESIEHYLQKEPNKEMQSLMLLIYMTDSLDELPNVRALKGIDYDIRSDSVDTIARYLVRENMRKPTYEDLASRIKRLQSNKEEKLSNHISDAQMQALDAQMQALKESYPRLARLDANIHKKWVTNYGEGLETEVREDGSVRKTTEVHVDLNSLEYELAGHDDQQSVFNEVITYRLQNNNDEYTLNYLKGGHERYTEGDYVSVEWRKNGELHRIGGASHVSEVKRLKWVIDVDEHDEDDVLEYFATRSVNETLHHLEGVSVLSGAVPSDIVPFDKLSIIAIYDSVEMLASNVKRDKLSGKNSFDYSDELSSLSQAIFSLDMSDQNESLRVSADDFKKVLLDDFIGFCHTGLPPTLFNNNNTERKISELEKVTNKFCMVALKSLEQDNALEAKEHEIESELER